MLYQQASFRLIIIYSQWDYVINSLVMNRYLSGDSIIIDDIIVNIMNVDHNYFYDTADLYY